MDAERVKSRYQSQVSILWALMITGYFPLCIGFLISVMIIGFFKFLPYFVVCVLGIEMSKCLLRYSYIFVDVCERLLCLWTYVY